MNWITGINRDGWPTAIPLDRIKQISVDPFGSVDPALCENGDTLVELRDEATRAEVLTRASVSTTDQLTEHIRMLCHMARGIDSRSERGVD